LYTSPEALSAAAADAAPADAESAESDGVKTNYSMQPNQLRQVTDVTESGLGAA